MHQSLFLMVYTNSHQLEFFKNVFFNTPNGTERRTGLHNWIGDLVLESDLAKVECPKTAKDSSNNPIYERTWDTTVDNSELLRYCRSQVQKLSILTTKLISKHM